MNTTPSYLLEFKRDNGNVVQIHAVDFSEESEHVTLEGAEDETRYAYSRTEDAALEVFTGI